MRKWIAVLLSFAMIFGFTPAFAEAAETRAEFVTQIGELFFVSPSQYQSESFSDVDAEKEYAPFISWAKENKIVLGEENSNFSPEEAITREEMAVMLLRTYQLVDQGPVGSWMIHLTYSDLSSISPWAGEAVAFCTLKQLFPITDNQFSPQSDVSAEEADAIFKTFSSQVLEGLYSSAVNDAKTIEPEEILPVVSITKDNEMVTWNEDGKVMMLTMHKYPDSYPAGEPVTLKWGEVWTFTDKEIKDWYHKNKDGVTDWNLRFKQLIGLPLDSDYTHVTGFWVFPEDIIRPAYEPDITKSEMNDHFITEPDKGFLSWFDGNIKWSYEDSSYPWTRLGYTYDWSFHQKEYGLSEFLIQKDSQTKVAFTYTIDEFLNWLNQ